MELHAYTRTISELLSVNRKYVVPRFQREYSWMKEQINELWYDIISNIESNEHGEYKNNEYFIGSLVLVGDETGKEMQIVDGQQRLTTITIFLSVLCDRFLFIGKPDLANAIFENYIEGKDDDGQKFFKLINETPKPYFQRNIQYLNKEEETPNTPEEKNLLAAYKEISVLATQERLNKHFSNSIQSNDEYEACLKSIRDQVLRYLKIIFITVSEEDEAYTIFDTLNARGMNLSYVDLIKNKLFKSLNGDHPSDVAKDNWRQIRTIISQRQGVGTIENFIRHWWVSKYAYVSGENLYKSFISKWRKGEIEPKSFIKEIREDAQLYALISAPNESEFPQMQDKPIYHSLNAIRLFGITQCRPFLLALLKAHNNGKVRHADLLKALRIVERFHFVFNAICSLRPSGIEGAYSKAARLISVDSSTKQSNGKAIDQLCDILVNRKPEISIFIEKFRDVTFTNEQTKQKKLIQYILGEFEMSRHNTMDFKPDQITLEHIKSQSSGTCREIGMIGNLLPLSKETNEKAGNKSIDDKIAVYETSEFKLTEEFIHVFHHEYGSNWNESTILDRTDRMAGEAYSSIWEI